MAIDNPEAIKFCNEVVRPLAESVRALKARIDSAGVTWFNGMSTLITNDSTAIEDGRADQGVSRLVGSDVVNLITQLLAIQTQLDETGVAAVISKPCVRSLEVS